MTDSQGTGSLFASHAWKPRYADGDGGLCAVCDRSHDEPLRCVTCGRATVAVDEAGRCYEASCQSRFVMLVDGSPRVVVVTVTG